MRNSVAPSIVIVLAMLAIGTAVASQSQTDRTPQTRISGEGFISEGIPKMPNPPGPVPKRDLSGTWIGPGTSNKPDPAPPMTPAGEAIFKQRKAYTSATNLGGTDDGPPEASNDPFITCDPSGFRGTC